jgi:iron complex transport system substrate-binding protein
MSPDLEQIAAMEPDVIIGQSGFFDNLRDALSNVAPMFLIYPNDVEDTVAELRMIGQITGHTEEAAEAIESFERKLAAYRELAPGDASVMMVFGAAEDDTMYIEASNGQTCSLFEDIAECPFDLPENPGQFAQFGYEFFSFEAILEVDPEVIFFSGYNVDRTENQEVVERLNENPLWLALSAVVDEAVYSIEPWVWRGGRGLTLMEETLDRALPILYPDVFEEPLSEEEIDDILTESEDEEEEDAS